jgi:hypothetical protein
MPYVKTDDKVQVDQIWAKTLARNKKGRGGQVDEGQQRTDETRQEDEETTKKKEKKYQDRYPEIRGLRYLPSTCTYFGRDPSAAGCIARLAAYRFKYGAKKKPAPFCRGQKTVEAEEDEEAQPAEDEEDQDDIQSNMNLFTEGS